MNEKEMIRRALMGEKQAQEECTAKGIVLPCPFCRGESRLEDMGWPHHVYCTKCGARSTSTKWGEDGEKETIKKWNSRPAPPIGRCGECKNWNEGDCYRQELTKAKDFCSYFEPREE